MRQLWCFCANLSELDQFSPNNYAGSLFETPFDALAEAPGELLVKVEVDELGGCVVADQMDASKCLHEFAMSLVDDAGLSLVDNPNLKQLLEVKKRWLSQEIDDKTLSVARRKVASDNREHAMQLAVLCACSPSPLNAARLTAQILDTDGGTHQLMIQLMDDIIARHEK